MGDNSPKKEVKQPKKVKASAAPNSTKA
jgi:hypothetical protein